MEDNVFEAMPLFRKFSVKLDEQIVTVRVSEEMEYILKQAKHRYWKLDTIRVL